MLEVTRNNLYLTIINNYDEATVLRTVCVSGFNKNASQKDLQPFFEQFKNLKRVFRVDANDPWQFTGSVFLGFDARENARKFLDFVSNARLIYNNSDVLHGVFHRGRTIQARDSLPVNASFSFNKEFTLILRPFSL